MISVNFSRRLINCFNIRQNYKELIEVKNVPKEIKCIHGIRALSALALLISHKVIALLYNPYINRSDMSAVSNYKSIYQRITFFIEQE